MDSSDPAVTLAVWTTASNCCRITMSVNYAFLSWVMSLYLPPKCKHIFKFSLMLQGFCEESMKKVFQIPRFVSKIIFDVVLCVI